jgi:hypothetical protein
LGLVGRRGRARLGMKRAVDRQRQSHDTNDSLDHDGFEAGRGL